MESCLIGTHTTSSYINVYEVPTNAVVYYLSLREQNIVFDECKLLEFTIFR